MRALKVKTVRQRGVAIITALLIVAIAVTISVKISTSLQLDVRRTSNMITLDQARFYTLAAESWAMRILRDDAENSTIDALDENWAIELPPIPIEGGSILSKLTDLSACLNINALLDATGKVDAVLQARLQRLFTNAGIKGTPVQAIKDWLDADLQTTNPDGAEDGYYLNLTPPYRVANQTMESISELRLVKGFEDPGIYNKVSQDICAYQVTAKANTININTASKEVLKSLAVNLTDQLADDIIEQRATSPFQKLAEFTSFNQLKTIVTETRGLSFSSNNFILRTQAAIGPANLVVYSVLHRDGNKVEVVTRSNRVY